MTSRRGFALITVLWVMTVAAAMAGVAALIGRNSVNGTRNRTELARAYWIATACVTRARAAIDAPLGSAESFDEAARLWRTLDRTVLPIALPTADRCEVMLEAAGTRLDVNAASDEVIGNLLRALDYDDVSATRMVDALADWRDTDSVARPDGSERDWYDAEHRELPRNGDLVDPRELKRVRGFENDTRFDSLVTVDHGRISLATAPAAVLLAVPGFTRETAETVVSLRDSGTPLENLVSLLSLVSPAPRESLLARFPDAARMTTVDPDGWILTVRAMSGAPPTTVELRLRLQRSGKHSVVTESRSTL